MYLRCVHFTVGQLFLKKKKNPGQVKNSKNRSLSEAFLLCAVITCDAQCLY